jgi:hypothetical protein
MVKKQDISNDVKKHVKQILKERAKAFEKKNEINKFSEGRFEYLGKEAKIAFFFKEIMSQYMVLRNWDNHELEYLAHQTLMYYEDNNEI